LTDNDNTPIPRLWWATDLRPAEQPRWLARNRLLRAAINLLVGDEGIGKSLFWVWIVAAVTRGLALLEFGLPARSPQTVVLILTEDDWTTTVLPRLEAAGADLSKIMVICTEDDGSGAPIFPADMHLILDADPAPALVVVDAWLDTVDGGLSVRDPQQARRALHPWRELATATDAAVLLLTHTNRVASGNARDKYGATGELRKKARMTLFAQQDDDGNLLIGPEKAKTARPVPAAMFAIESVQHFDATEDDDGIIARLAYLGDSELTARDHIIDKFDGDHGDDRQERADAVTWLREYLELEGPAKSADAKREAKKAGISERTLVRARKKVGAVIGYTGQPPVSTWSLPDQGEVVDGEVVDSAATPPAPRPSTVGATGATGVTAGHSATPHVENPSYATHKDMGATVAQLGSAAPGAPTSSTPGMTTKVAEILANQRSQFPVCESCGRRVAGHGVTRCAGCADDDRHAS